MAMDYLPIPASAMPCEQVFSSSAETDTKKRNRISPLLMEALQMVKFHLKQEHLNFTKTWMTDQKEMMEDKPEEDLFDKLLKDNSEDARDNTIWSINAGED